MQDISIFFKKPFWAVLLLCLLLSRHLCFHLASFCAISRVEMHMTQLAIALPYSSFGFRFHDTCLHRMGWSCQALGHALTHSVLT
jgi:hypothetical protein